MPSIDGGQGVVSSTVDTPSARALLSKATRQKKYKNGVLYSPGLPSHDDEKNLFDSVLFALPWRKDKAITQFSGVGV